jgi:serine/threonine protein kinase
LMRLEKADYSIPLFHEEVQILAIMDKIPGINRMLECGFIKMENGGSLPSDSALMAIQNLSGPCLRIGMDACQNFPYLLDERVKDGWTPYLILEKQEKENNLLMLCDAGLNHGRYLPLTSLLQMTIQICDIMQAAHDRHIVYRDHKILHYYWHEDTNGVFMIDWNVARLHSETLTDYERRMDLVQFGARGMHYILTGRSAPGALPLGPTRPDEIEQAAETYRTQWTYDDERLPQGLRDILEEVLAGKYSHAADLRDDLKGIYMHV